MGNSTSQAPALTPERIAKENIAYSIPIYQRLFAWTPCEVKALLEDLYTQFSKGEGEHYYIGLLTSTDKHELVDGQQRFTVMMLLGSVMQKYHSQWTQFLKTNTELRLSFTARADDDNCLKEIVESLGECEASNQYMKAAIDTISSFLERDDRSVFSKYVYEHLAFFIQELPKGYSGKMLNKYFESMNSTGRNLENHEILKVSLLKEAKIEDDSAEYDRLVTMWNCASRMGQTVLPIYEEKRSEYKETIRKISEKTFRFDGGESDERSKDIRSILQDHTILKKSSPKEKASNLHSFLKFNDFLLLVLYLKLTEGKSESDIKAIIPNISVFFKRENLRKTFALYEESYDEKEFIEDLYIYRIILDWAIIRVDDTYNYDLAMTSEEHNCLEQYEAMLYASTSQDTYYQWIPVILRHVRDTGADEAALLKLLKDNDNAHHPIKNIGKEKVDMTINDLSFSQHNLYFYRRLDYYLWESIKKLEHGDCLTGTEGWTDDKFAELRKAVVNYKFHQYNSLEHLYPQTDTKQKEERKWKDDGGSKDWDDINAFGNMALISGPFNSAQGNDALGRKFGTIRDQIDQNKLESIKLALMYYAAHGEAGGWTIEKSQEHGKLMFAFLEKTYGI